jgi:general secretion pathway protein F
VGAIIRGYAVARLCQLMGAMLGNGVPLISALHIAKDGAGNVLMREAVERAAAEVRDGRALSSPLAESGLFDEDVVEMIAVGEAANSLDTTLAKIGDSLEARLDRMLTMAVRLIEPLLLLVIAGVIATVAFALLLPLTKLGSTLQP